MIRSIEVFEARSRAIRIVGEAIRCGELERPDKCELCDRKPGNKVNGISKIVAHHWKGYDHPLSVWFICHTCNMRLRGEEYHNGSVSKDEAKKIVIRYDYPKPIIKSKFRFCGARNSKGGRCKRRLSNGNKYCAVHDPKNQKCKAVSHTTGLPCTRNISYSGQQGYCYHHRKYRPENQYPIRNP